MLRLIVCLAAASTARAYVSVVTGASGFVGRAVVHSLLEQREEGATDAEAADPRVVCLVRPDKVSYEAAYWDAHLLDRQASSRRKACVKVMPYDMLDGGATLKCALENAVRSDDAASRLCLYHIASVFGPTPDPIRTAKDNVESTEDVVRTLDRFRRRHPRSKARLVLTSSMAAVRSSDRIARPEAP